MNKWIFIVIGMAGAAWHFTHKGQTQHDNQYPPSEVIQTPSSAQEADNQSPTQTNSREPSEEQCRSIGGRFMDGMGCVVGAPTGNANPHISPAEMESHCASTGARYVAEINSCVSH